MKLNEYELDALTEVINVGVGRAASSLSEITDSTVKLAVPNIYVCGTPEFSEIATTLNLGFSTSVQQAFEGDLSGRALLAFSSGNAFELARLVGGIQTSDTDMDAELSGIVAEIGNIVLNAVLGSIANFLDCRLSYQLPQLCTKSEFSKIILQCSEDAQNSRSLALLADTAITVASHDLSGSLLVLFETDDIVVMLSALTARLTV
ncbi:MAG: hypothetical protein IID44_11835 [Planctomycetes bacterium]|nr:hypothetical protein [Planctomycetota bacterium]